MPKPSLTLNLLVNSPFELYHNPPSVKTPSTSKTHKKEKKEQILKI